MKLIAFNPYDHSVYEVFVAIEDAIEVLQRQVPDYRYMSNHQLESEVKHLSPIDMDARIIGGLYSYGHGINYRINLLGELNLKL
ncbi:hypothetical protein EGO58_06045 [Limosilactobacillus reuteri]|uniref:hypothetical protein n=1 Tax=Limosilactobacillus reuteri TaxID=1598 RepID=UPI000F4E56E1|nr:hypothetical protein [Limosilactobacillus reuteri]MCC4485316.1 hypothetical protein [Limosilactobacillus reuteri]MDZ5438304.1 hypothetical protein [Limosilactobacillus reuteri]ROV63056.1 hypothetical protein EGO58_06045 [Limosilactobacillus reuteri]